MTRLLEELEQHFAQKYETKRSEIQNAQRLALRHLDQVVNVDCFTTGTVHVGGKDGPLKDEVQALVDGFRKDPEFFSRLKAKAAEAPVVDPREAILQHTSEELFAFLPDHDKRTLIAAYEVLLSDLVLTDYSPVIMPVGRVYEGFFAKVLVGLGICTRTAIQDAKFNFYNALESADARKFKAKASTHEAQLEAAKQRLREFCHIQLHSQSSQFMQYSTKADATRFVERVLRDTQSLFDYFKKHFE